MLAKLDDFEMETIYISLVLLQILSGSTGDEQTAREHRQALSTLWFYLLFDKHEKLKCSINIIFDYIYKSKDVKFTNIESWETNIFQSTSSLDHLNKSDHFKLTNIKVYDYGKLTFAINIEFCQHQYIINSQIHESYILINTRNRHVSSKASYDNIENNEILTPKSMIFW